MFRKNEVINMKRIMILMLIAVTVFLSACGGQTQGKVIKPSDFLNKDTNEIWYFCEDKEITKDTLIDNAILFKDGDAYIYPLNGVRMGGSSNPEYELARDSGLTLGDVAGCTDEEALAKIDEACENMVVESRKSAAELIDEWVKKTHNTYEREIVKEDGWEQIVSDRASGLKTNVDELLIKWPIFKLTPKVALYTDGSGNNTAKECVKLTVEGIEVKTNTKKCHTGLTGSGGFEMLTDNSTTTDVNYIRCFEMRAIDGTFAPTPIYDSYFGGFTGPAYYDKTGFFLKQCNEDTVFDLDTPDYEHENFIVDPEDLEDALK